MLAIHLNSVKELGIMSTTRNIRVDYIARTEGDGAFDILIDSNGKVKKASWNIFLRLF